MRLKVDQGDGRFGGATRVLTLELVVHVQGLGRQNKISTRPLAAAFDAPVKICPAVTIIYLRRGGGGLCFEGLSVE